MNIIEDWAKADGTIRHRRKMGRCQAACVWKLFVKEMANMWQGSPVSTPQIPLRGYASMGNFFLKVK